jgi:GLPGLI family protein
MKLTFDNYSNKQKHTQLFIKMFGLTVLMLFSSLTYAQKTEGVIRYLMTEDYVKEMAAVDYLSKQAIDRLAYMYGGNRGIYKSYSTLWFNPTQTKYEDSEERPGQDFSGWSYRKDEYTITRNFEKRTIHDYIDLLQKTYIIEDTLPVPKWRIMNDMKEILGHLCMNAVYYDSLKMQRVIGWYAMDIPVTGGPERFYGLPGLILEVDINNGAMVITADKIELKKLTTELDFPKKAKGKKIKEKDYVAILKKHIAEKRKLEQPSFYSIRY